jgi:glutathione synthase/RimK-type ligase-like ATP-grasp enzyme
LDQLSAYNSRTSHKLDQLRIAQKIGLQIPETLVTASVDEFQQFYERLAGKVITKPLYNGSVNRQGENDTIIYTNRVTGKFLEKIDEIQNCPTLFQEYIEKKADVRITIIDKQIEAVEMIAFDYDGQQRAIFAGIICRMCFIAD